jgi:spore coat protein CotH
MNIQTRVELMKSVSKKVFWGSALLSLSLLGTIAESRGQSLLGSERGFSMYQDSILGRIDVFLPADSLAEMLADPFSNREYLSTVVFTKGGVQDSLFECGLRIRGNTSRNAQKKQFRISLNTFRPGQNLEGISDHNLYGMHNDPSICRAKFYYDLTHRVGGGSARAAHVNLYFNGQFRGVYVHVEQLNEDFLQTEFAQDYGNLYKCLWPADFGVHFQQSQRLQSNLRRPQSL